MGERKIDKNLGIRTVGLREWDVESDHLNRYEPTPYKVLDMLSENYNFEGINRVIDFGCGKGRVAFYLHNRFGLEVTGIEANSLTYEEALENKESYMRKMEKDSVPINFKFGLAQDYRIGRDDDCFYFFNPFSIHTFRKVVYNILDSVERHKRTVDMILYYPLPEFEAFLGITPFRLIDEIDMPQSYDSKDKILIYRLGKDASGTEDSDNP